MEQKKAFRIGKFNIIDIIAVALILAVALYAVVRVLNRGGTIEVPTRSPMWSGCRTWPRSCMKTPGKTCPPR